LATDFLAKAFLANAFLAMDFLAKAFLLVSDLVTPSCEVGALATLAFLVVLRVLIRDFFWIDIAELLLN
jgi:hypothetical protein